ncbi:MAG: hypothetical protein HEEMFOPI_02042 [Holosporales bacterium]
MNEEKVKEFIRLLDVAIDVAMDRRYIMKTLEFHEKCLKAGWIKKEDIDLGLEHLKKKYEIIYHFKWLEENIILRFLSARKNFSTGKPDEWIINRAKGSRPSWGITRGMSDYEGLWGDELYDCSIYNACADIERYYKNELE